MAAILFEALLHRWLLLNLIVHIFIAKEVGPFIRITRNRIVEATRAGQRNILYQRRQGIRSIPCARNIRRSSRYNLRNLPAPTPPQPSLRQQPIQAPQQPQLPQCSVTLDRLSVNDIVAINIGLERARIARELSQTPFSGNFCSICRFLSFISVFCITVYVSKTIFRSSK